MVVVTLPTKELQSAIPSLKGDFSKELGEVLFKIGMELESSNAEETAIDIAGAGNRIDAVSLEGVARIVNAYLGKQKLAIPKVKKGNFVVNVDKSVVPLRPYIGVFIARGVEFTDANLKRIMNYQDKIHGTFGRERSMLAMGIYKLAEVKPPLQFTALSPKEINFAPLGYEQKMNGFEILANHPTGKAHAHLLKNQSKYPVFQDANGKILSLIPIINSNDVGKVQPGKHDVLVEASGFNLNLLTQLLASNALDLLQMGATIETCTVNYSGKKIVFPDFTFNRYTVPVSDFNSLLGLNLTSAQIAQLLERMLLPATAQGNKVQVNVPKFRSDVLHPVDIIEDAARAYGFDKFVPEAPAVYTVGKKHPRTLLFRAIANAFVGMQFQQVIGMVLTNKQQETTLLGQDDNRKFVELHSSRALGLNACRQSLLPGMLSIIASNKQYSYPQKIFEVGECLELDAKSETGARTTWKIGAVMASSSTSFEEAKATVEALGRALDDYKLKFEPASDSRFIKGRCARVTGKLINGLIGEVDLQVLRNFNIEMPSTAIELELKQE